MSDGKPVSETHAQAQDLTDFGEPHPAPDAHGQLARAAYVLGGFGLVMATLSDSLAVAGRHVGLPLLGAIELVQVAVVLLASSAMLIVTLAGGHATVHMFTERLSPPNAQRLSRLAALLSGLVFLAIAAGSAWVGAELWNGFEETELLHLPLRWLRLLWIVIALLIAARFFAAALRKAQQ